MFDKFTEAAIDVLYDAYEHSRRFKSENISSEHLLAALAQSEEHLAGQALASMNVKAEAILQELEHSLLAGKKKDIAPAEVELCSLAVEELKFNFPAKLTIKRAGEIRVFYGHPELEPEHILLALIDNSHEAAIKVLEELGANITHLGRVVLEFLAKRDCFYDQTPNLRNSVLSGFDKMVDERVNVIEDIERLAASTDTKLADLPQKSEIAHLIFTAYMHDFLFTQTGYQRYLLEETLTLLRKRAGNLDPEFVAAAVSSSAQNLRQDVRYTIEYIWSHEFRLLSKLPDEADYDLIGSVIEDIWWTHSEEIALNQVFDEALDDHRRKQMLKLQKRRLEIAEKFVKLKARLQETLKQCFLKKVNA